MLGLTDLNLASACLRGETRALLAFDALLDRATATLARIDTSPAFVDEVRQRVRVRLLVGDGAGPRIASYSGRGPLSAFVQVAVLRTALNLRRDERMLPLRCCDTPTVDDDVESAELRRRGGESLRAAFRAAVAALPATDRELMRRHFLRGQQQRTIADDAGLDTSFVSRRLKKIRLRLRADTEARLRAVVDGETFAEAWAQRLDELAELDLSQLFRASRARSRVFQARR